MTKVRVERLSDLFEILDKLEKKGYIKEKKITEKGRLSGIFTDKDKFTSLGLGYISQGKT